MGRFLNPDNTAFQTALNSEIYIDKTELLTYTNKVIGTKQAFICNSRPRRFGKSITADMLTAYYSKGCDSKEMFAPLRISQSDSFDGNSVVYGTGLWRGKYCFVYYGADHRRIKGLLSW